ncbi:MAG: hypothetical protein J5798_09090 [Spirochaetaceae bacterium]|nr:hypothetical protein [Spirochaetaceae bacterium]
MKKSIFLLILCFLAFVCFAQKINIMDYFPTEIGTMWSYTNENEKMLEIITIENSSKNSDNSYLYLFSDYVDGLGTTKSLYNAQNNKICLVVAKDLFGNYHEKKDPCPVILADPDKKGTYIDNGDNYNYEVIKSNCKFDDKNFPDCIVVIEKIVANDTILRTKKSYYAKGIGLVYETIIGSSNKETVYRKLVTSSITIN